MKKHEAIKIDVLIKRLQKVRTMFTNPEDVEVLLALPQDEIEGDILTVSDVDVIDVGDGLVPILLCNGEEATETNWED